MNSSINLLIVVAIALVITPLALFAVEFRAEFRSLETLYQSGNLNELGARLMDVKARNNEESSLLLYLNAMLRKSKTDSASLLEDSARKYPNTHYGQLSMLELAKLHLQERDASKAKSYLQKITSQDLLERYYWLAVCAEAGNDFSLAIANCETYLRLAPRGKLVEEAYFLIAEAYQYQGKFQSAISSLKKLQALDGYPRAVQYFHYKMGYLQQLANKPNEALESYKTGLEIDRLSHIAFLIEDRLFELKDKYPASVDLSFLYPYTELQLPETVAATKPVNGTKLPLKLDNKPSGGFFLQVGRFSQESNATRMSASIRDMDLLSSYYEDKDNRTVPWVVVSGPYQTKNEAEMIRQALLDRDINCFITQF
ncbi:MAG TPA: SPOR domain-containing protein [Candidatus Cloacimonadota bacterium]|nr:SPOR domain-containing protein [Candidatus Cloacimonadota bacterium]HOF59565.1 SPOR domain-containing protein [Candidatus Cloacimonadota bacterium]HOR58722.1 SPOR domain-containing protein [Candidatus Cloacimonadota bacterium]HPB08125.1 SPOR domain-containing protein [Candidatus Cloacimonadota bacterium]HQL14021.1 SPOR domain-containing protein [Candidatus Cloacimonadota bacterium]